MRTQQGKGLILVLILAALVVGAVVYFYRGNSANPLPSTPIDNSSNNSNQTNQNTQATTTTTGEVNLMIDPATVSTTNGQTFNVDVKADPKSEEVGGATVKLKFDPDYLEATAIKAGSILPVVLDQGKVAIGSAEITVGASPNAPMKQAGVIATVTFKAKKTGNTQITIDQASQVAANGKYVQGSTAGADVTIK